MAKKIRSIDLSDSFEKIPVKIFPGLDEGSKFVAQQIAPDKVKAKKQAEMCIGSCDRLYSQIIVRRIGPDAQGRETQF